MPKALFLYSRITRSTSCNYRSWFSVLSSKITYGVIPFAHAPSYTKAISENFLFALIPPLLFASAQRRLNAIILDIVHTINIKNFLFLKENSHGSLFMGIRSNPICKLFSLIFMSISEERIDYLLYKIIL